MRVAAQYDKDYWDGDRKYGYGGMKYDGRYKPVAAAMAEHYDLKNGDSVLDIGCGKGFLLHDLNEDFGMDVYGLDISEYANEQAQFHGGFSVQSCTSLPYRNAAFDFTYSINTFHNLGYADLKLAIREMVRVSRDKSYICVESYRNEEELCHLQGWALTCKSFYTPDDWMNILSDNGYKGDLECIFFD